MYFKKLELIGFKSFLEKTILHFESGVTTIVGPNGCGKSNIFDSIRWVLGEQSAKSLRGSEMQDVIFNGTDSKDPLGMAEVTLTFENEGRFFPVEHNEVAITRRIFRSGESQYLLNKTLVRLKDITDLLSGTGIGAESYSMVAQGKIDLILSSHPEDRRLVFDEAAGITKYKSQKRESARRLEETEQNLLRVNDIIAEVKRQIGSLERQANKARRYKEVFEELKTKEIQASVLEKEKLFKERDSIQNELAALQKQEEQVLNTIKEQELRVNNRQQEIKAHEDAIMSTKNQIFGMENQIVGSTERINFNKEKIKELETSRAIQEKQVEHAKARLVMDEEKLSKARQEYGSLHNDIEEKNAVLKQNESQLDSLAQAIKASLENIARAKKDIMELAVETAKVNNTLSDSSAKEQTFLARKKRLELEKAKLSEEKTASEENLKNITLETESVMKTFENLSLTISKLTNESSRESASLGDINSQLEESNKRLLTLESHREFIEKLKTKYEDIGEALNAVIELDKMPSEQLTGLVVKIKPAQEQEGAGQEKASGGAAIKLSGEAKPIDLDTERIGTKINSIRDEINLLKDTKRAKENRIVELNNIIQKYQQELRDTELNLANRKALQQSILEQVNKIKDEEEIIAMELSDVEKEINALESMLAELRFRLSEQENKRKAAEDLISSEQESISLNTGSKESLLVVIAQTKTQLDALNKRIATDEGTIKILEDAFYHDKLNLENLERLFLESQDKSGSLSLEIKELESKINDTAILVQGQKDLLKEAEDKYRQVLEGSAEAAKRIDSDRKEYDALKNTLYELQMKGKDNDFKYQSIKERILAAYKTDLESLQSSGEIADRALLMQEIQGLKEKLDSYGTVNLVAIEEYDELKKRYDFLIQQQGDLIAAKESLHQAILKINRTTKQLFLETFEKIRVEFKSYFRLLFNGGDAQLFLLDEQDPLESGIEIICRPPGKKLQNVFLLSGGEKSLSAIALIFAIFKIKPSPFCILDEIDAALDEANIDRYSRLLQELTQASQFIIITHNKKTIANADVMYGITMQESGVSKIISVKFAQDNKDKESEKAVAELT